MKGVSEVIAIILILMITIAIAGLAYTFMSSTMSSTTSAASSAVDTTTSSMSTSFVIENMDIAKAYVRNTGQTTLSNINVYVNDEPAIFDINPSTLTSGQVGSITIYSFIPDGATVKITSPNGFSASKVADECTKAIGCWKFDENSGAVAYDSSSYGNSGTLMNGPSWTSGRYGGALSFDGINDYLIIPNTSTIYSYPMSISLWVKNGNNSQTGHIIYGGEFISAGDGWGGENETHLSINIGNVSFFSQTNGVIHINNQTIRQSDFNWHHVVVVLNSTFKLYMDGVQISSGVLTGIPNFSNYHYFFMGKPSGMYRFFNGTIDEVRIYNRAIY